MSRLTTKIRDNDFQSIRKAINQLSYERLGTQATPIWNTIELSGITASRLLYGDSGSKLASVSSLTDWIAGTTYQVTVTDDSDGSVTLSLPQNIHTGAIPTFAGMTLTGNLDMSENEIQNFIVHNVADEAARTVLDKLPGRVVYQVDTGELYLATIL